ncbi:PREDICTED: bcl-2-like protein 13-like [Lipotes vexillifer]|uniref:Bcl-2-like protein 13-like n=1 Tax=Lipotes vexillifer TaxID=118797 RepID=A0A340X7T6_LIPVE|nr:PREDICTED: bcl-2-like protein 13-like [Lipotes vexillifer]
MASSPTVPLGAHDETKCAVLGYLGVLSQEELREHLSSPQGVRQDMASQSLDQEILLKGKTEIEELKSPDEEISEAFVGASDFATTDALGVDKVSSGALQRIAAVWCDSPGGPRRRAHQVAGWLGHCL